MTKYLFDIFSITIIVVFIVDLSGWTDTWKGWLHKWLRVPIGRARPFDCSLCTTWWAGCVYLLCVGKFTLPWLAAVSVFAMCTPVVLNMLLTIIDLLNILFNFISKLCKRN